MLIPGLVSISFRKLRLDEVINLTVTAKLASIEWGGDMHVPHGNLSIAREARQRCFDAGIQVSAYGSYYRAGADRNSFEAILDTAAELGTDTVRVWAGNRASVDSTPAERSVIVDDLVVCCGLAQAKSIKVCTEFHSGTLTDTPDSWLRLYPEVNRPNMYTFWQPPNGASAHEAVSGLSRILPYTSNLHIFHWWPTHRQRLPLAEGAERWKQYLHVANSDDRKRFASLEFVKDDQIEQLLEDAGMLRSWLSELSP